MKPFRPTSSGITPLGKGEAGQVFISMRHSACKVAEALRAGVVFLSDVPGILRNKDAESDCHLDDKSK
jgi:acetylglutamate kinase